MKDKILNWFATGETGISSKAMACAIADLEVDKKWAKFGNHPSDPDDFNRCLKFLAAVPEARQHLDKVAALSKTWAKLVENWSAIEKCFIDEVGFDWSKGDSAKKTFDLMESVIFANPNAK